MRLGTALAGHILYIHNFIFSTSSRKYTGNSLYNYPLFPKWAPAGAHFIWLGIDVYVHFSPRFEIFSSVVASSITDFKELPHPAVAGDFFRAACTSHFKIN